MNRKKTALVLSGGGARGAYQAGVLKAWEDVFRQGAHIEIINGISAGSVNAFKLAQKSDNYVEAINQMISLWVSIHTGDVFDSSLRGLVRNTFNIIRSSRKGWSSANESIDRAILDNSPLREFLSNNINIPEMREKLKNDQKLVMATTCFDYTSMKNVTFFETEGEISNWERDARRGFRTKLTIDHLMASCSLPLIFPTVNIGEHYFGDGSLRNIAPLHPAILLKAERIICIKLNGPNSIKQKSVQPTMGNVAEAILHSLVVDAVEYDSKMLYRINDLSNKIPGENKQFKEIELCLISPQIDFNQIALKLQDKFPKSLRYLFSGWLSPELLSYLMFDGDFCEILIEEGYKEGKKHLDTAKKWLLV